MTIRFNFKSFWSIFLQYPDRIDANSSKKIFLTQLVAGINHRERLELSIMIGFICKIYCRSHLGLFSDESITINRQA